MQATPAPTAPVLRAEPERPFTPVAGSPPRALPSMAPPDVRMTVGDAPVPPPASQASAPQPSAARLAPPPVPVAAALKTSFPDGVSASFDLVYARLDGYRPLTLDLYQPRASGTPLPLVVFIHGGSWTQGDARHAGTFPDFPAQLAALAARGYVVASVNYRLSQEARFPAALQDVKAAIRWLRGRATDYNIDTTRVAAWGAAAGGQLAALAGTTCGVDRFEPEGDAARTDLPSNCVQAVIDWHGVSDLQTLAADGGKPATGKSDFTKGSSSPEAAYLGCEPAQCPPGLARLTSPIGFISVMSPPFLIQHGAQDAVVPPEQSRKLQAALQKAGVPVELVIYPEAGHDFARDGQPDAALNAQVMDKVATFLAASFPTRRVAEKTAPIIRRGLN